MRNYCRVQSIRRWLFAQQSLRSALKKCRSCSWSRVTIKWSSRSGRPSSRLRSTPKNAHVVFSRAYLRTRTHARHAHVRRENLALHVPLPDFLRILLFPLAIRIRCDTLDKRHDGKNIDFSHEKIAFWYDSPTYI